MTNTDQPDLDYREQVQRGVDEADEQADEREAKRTGGTFALKYLGTKEAGSLHMRLSTDEALLSDFQSLIERDANNGIEYPADDTEAFRAEILRRMKFGAR